MVLGLSLQAFTTLHVAISLIAIAAGLLVLLAMIGGRDLKPLTALFLVTTALTSLTGFLFPFKGVTPGIVIGILSLIVLALAMIARRRGWPGTYAITATLALYFNVFVLIVQSFEKVPSLHALAPTQTETPFKVAQLLTLVLFVVLTALAFRKRRAAI
ncbi:MAG TPA: hypothetical protein VKB47_01620 [Terracidiphilus sp.]|nr:hypothetical protein [Terracidiphilus sp.]